MKDDLKERLQTVRQLIQKELEIGPATTLDISKLVSIREKEVVDHLNHLEKSLKHEKKKLITEPALCHNCGFVFSDRKKLTKPSACPKCRKSRIEHQKFSIK